MKKIFQKRILNICLLTFFIGIHSSFSQTVFHVKTNQVTTTIKSTMWGLFFEDINLGADGGLYAELIKNRSFEFDVPLMGWKEIKSDKAKGTVLVNNIGDVNESNRRYIHMESFSDQGYGWSNEGFRGMGIKKDETYNFSVMARQSTGSLAGLKVELADEKGNVVSSAKIYPKGNEWKTYKVSFKSNQEIYKAHLNIYVEGKGEMDLDMISLFPLHTWKERPNGLRADMVQL